MFPTVGYLQILSLRHPPRNVQKSIGLPYYPPYLKCVSRSESGWFMIDGSVAVVIIVGWAVCLNLNKRRLLLIAKFREKCSSGLPNVWVWLQYACCTKTLKFNISAGSKTIQDGDSPSPRGAYKKHLSQERIGENFYLFIYLLISTTVACNNQHVRSGRWPRQTLRFPHYYWFNMESYSKYNKSKEKKYKQSYVHTPIRACK